VDDDHVAWTTPLAAYRPVEFTHDNTLKAKGADPPNINEVPDVSRVL